MRCAFGCYSCYSLLVLAIPSATSTPQGLLFLLSHTPFRGWVAE